MTEPDQRQHLPCAPSRDRAADEGATTARGDPYVAAIRGAMASGWGLVVAGSHVRTAYEAARGCGRLDDVVLVHARPPALLSSYVGVETRAAPADWGTGKWKADWREPPRVPGDVARPGAVTLVLDAERPDLVAPPLARSMATEDGPPVLLVHSVPPPPGVQKPPPPAMARFPEGSAPACDGEAALARHAALPSLAVEGDVAVLAGGGRTVLAQLVPLESGQREGSRPSRPTMRVFECEADGWVAYAEWRVNGMDSEGLEAWARHAWLCGTHRPPAWAKAAGCSNAGHGNLPWAPGRPKREHAAVVDAFGDDALDLQAGLADIVPAQAVYRASRRGDAARRAQFLRTWPAFRDDLLDPAVAGAVDAGARVAPVIGALHGVPAATVRRLAGRPKPVLWDFLDRQLGHGRGASAIAAIGHDRLPPRLDGPGWEAFDSLARELVDTLTLAGIGVRPGPWKPPGPWVAAMLLGIPGRGWAERRRTVEALAPFARPGMARDLLHNLAYHLRALGHPVADIALALRLFPADRGLAGLVSAAVAWHEDPVLRLGTHGIGPDAAWEVPFGPADLGDGWTAVPLDRMAALLSEGMSGPDADGVDGLEHCVASYAPRCVRGDSLIVSLRRADDGARARASTAELVSDRTGAWTFAGFPGVSMRLAQHRGLRNAPPPREAAAALDRLRSGLADGTVPSRPASWTTTTASGPPARPARCAFSAFPRCAS